MSSPPSTRPSTSSRANLHGSQSIYPPGGLMMSSSRPFLNMMNPMSRTHQGYTQANQFLVEENENDTAEEDLEAGHATRGILSKSTKSHGKHRVSWDGESSEMNMLRPNIRKEDRTYEQESDDDVPQRFMIEDSPLSGRPSKGKGRSQPLYSTSARSLPHATAPPTDTLPMLSIPPRPSEVDVDEPPQTPPERLQASPKPMRGLDDYERALWNWVNVYNLDAFLQEVYLYYEGKGIYSIALARGLNLLTVGFVIGFSTFLLGCVDYSLISEDETTHLSDAVVDRCVSKFSGFTLLFFLLFAAFYVWQIISFVFEVMRLVNMYKFYTYLLRVPDADIPTIAWPEIVRRIAAIREENPITAISSAHGTNAATPATASLDAHDIANRIMRQENYLIALFNKDVLDLRVPLPPKLKQLLRASDDGKGRTLTRVLEWNLRFCLMEYLFDPQGRVRKVFLKTKNRAVLINGLRRRLVFMGILNAIFAPFIVLYMIMYSFFRYFEEYHKNPSSIGGRRYTPFAQWKFREFNELSHLFTRRLDESYPLASMYIGQFPNEKMTIIMRFVAFIAGSFAAVLVLASVIDPDLVLHFEITPHRTVLFYLGVFGSVLAVARGMIPEDNRVFDPELLMTEVIQYTHYMPDEWKEELHSKKVHQEFGELFAMKIPIFVQEIVSVLTTPFILWFSLPPCAPVIVDFFHDFTVWVPGRGYICSFAEFDFKRHGNVRFGAPSQNQDERMMSREGKMEKSFLNFKAANPDWNPSDPSGSLYLSRIADLSARRRLSTSRTALDNTVLLNDGNKDPAERVHEYDRALRQSQHAALRRRLQLGGGNIVTRGGGGVGSSTIWQSAIGSNSAMGMAQTAVLGDSQGSIAPLPPPIRDEDRNADGGVGSGLGDSYVDGDTQGKKPYESQQEGIDDEEELEDGGVLGLLAQIYAAKGTKHVPVI
ncbi:putative transmembrane protein [Suillus clintonianus]|uniref:putative transmembrane protein n=1 Tax=Suillus clintonianus TaxID=1904413 RepID=UPI001B86AED0|nr:putative transmembrane protein [Suillus clintonianus]KAG2157500.1 putative transmembrane protein [Suillus clintonianus]